MPQITSSMKYQIKYPELNYLTETSWLLCNSTYIVIKKMDECNQIVIINRKNGNYGLRKIDIPENTCLAECAVLTEENLLITIFNGSKDRIMRCQIDDYSSDDIKVESCPTRQNYITKSTLRYYIPRFMLPENGNIRLCMCRGALFVSYLLNTAGEILSRQEITRANHEVITGWQNKLLFTNVNTSQMVITDVRTGSGETIDIGENCTLCTLPSADNRTLLCEYDSDKTIITAYLTEFEEEKTSEEKTSDSTNLTKTKFITKQINLSAFENVTDIIIYGNAMIGHNTFTMVTIDAPLSFT